MPLRCWRSTSTLLLLTYAVLRLQGLLPLNPLGFAGTSEHLAFNTAISFTTNTNWQSYGGETTMSNLSQMLGLTIHNFLSAATGIALAFALFRGFARRSAAGIGNFWADVTRVTLYLLLPLCIVYALFLIASGVPQTLAGSVDIATLEGAKQTLALGPVASQEAIKMLGTNGGGFFNVNSAHPFENPTAVTNFVADAVDLRDRLRADLDLRQGGRRSTAGLGHPRGDAGAVPDRRRHHLLARKPSATRCSTALAWRVATWRARRCASASPPRRCLPSSPPRPRAARSMPCTTASRRWAAWSRCSTSSWAKSSSAVSAPGIYGFLLFAILAVFVAGLMVGRTPEYVGKKIEAREVKLAVLAIAILPLTILGMTAVASVVEPGLAGPLNKGPHGFSEILYAFTSAVGNNGSAFAGLTANTPFYNAMLGVAMWLGRFFVIVPMLAIAGSLAAKKVTPASAGSFPTTGPLWVGLLVGDHPDPGWPHLPAQPRARPHRRSSR